MNQPTRPRPAAATAALLQRALAVHQQGRLTEADALYREILAQDPEHFDALHLSGVIAYQQGRYDAAVASIGRALMHETTQAAPYSNLGLALLAQGRHDAALACFDRALTLQPEQAGSHSNRGNALRGLKRNQEALACYDRALALQPDFALAHSNRGNILQDLQRHEEAVASYDAALRLQPEYAEAHNNRAHALRRLNRLADALASCERALQIRPDYADAHNNLGNILQDLGRHEAARASYARALALRPDYAEAHLNDALCRLALGDFERGWQAYEWRWASPTHRSARRDFTQPLWLGQFPLAGRTLLLHAEQGLGDTLQFCRFASLLAAQGATILLEVQAPLAGLLATLAGVSRVLIQGQPLPDFDCHCPLLSLPHALRLSLAQLPAIGLPYLAAEPVRAAQWRARLAPRPRPWVGLSWSGNPTHVNDHNRSLPLAALDGLWRRQGTVVAVQTRMDAAERDAFRAAGGVDPAELLADFADTAALLSCLDHVLSVDTAAAHLAGALALPATVLLPFNADFRWLIGRGDSPWYPTLRILRQGRAGDWSEAIAQALATLPSA
jgi:tetratricopeptide (TPR) repeat protein